VVQKAIHASILRTLYTYDVQDAAVDDQGDRVDAAYRDQSGRLWRALVGYTGDRELASDAMAEAFTRAIHHQDEIQDLSAWVWRVSFRLAAADLRQRSKASGIDPDDGTVDIEANLPDLVRALRELPPKQRLAVVLHDYADRPTREVAEILGSSSATVRVHLSRARRRLRGLLEERHA
jgi:RNA polymerase sigma-70 factor (ECF subfamily)